MGRKPSKPGAIPRFRPRRQKSGRVCYYYDHGIGPDGKRREEALGSDYGLAIKRWAELEREASPPPQAALLFSWVADRYMAEVAPGKAARTAGVHGAGLPTLPSARAVSISRHHVPV